MEKNVSGCNCAGFELIYREGEAALPSLSFNFQIIVMVDPDLFSRKTHI
jgi:hypothetical protein